MTDHSGRFSGKVTEYAQYRERYDPGIVLPYLRAWCGLVPEWLVADIGAGTGMVGDLFRANRNRVIAVEPNAEMRAACARLHAGDEGFRIIDGSAESIGLDGDSVEMIAIGRALHWFDLEPAFGEFRRILKPRGWIAILANGRSREGREENRAFRELLRSCSGRDAGSDLRHDIYRQSNDLFPGGEFHYTEVHGEMQVDWNELRGLALSLSYSPMPDSPDFPAFESALRRYFERFAQNERITFATRIWIGAGRFAD